MSTIFVSRVSSLLSLAALTVVWGGLSAQAETTNVAAAPIQSSEPTAQTAPAPATLAQVASTANDAATTVAPESTAQVFDPQSALEPSAVLPQESSVTVAGSTSARASKATTQASAADLLAEPSASQVLDGTSDVAPAVAQVPPVDPGRGTLSSSSFVGLGGSVGFVGDTALGERNIHLSVLSKIGLTPRFSVRPGAVIDFDSNATLLLPVTIDFARVPVVESAVPFPEPFSRINPFVGAGLAINVGDDTDIGPMLTGGIDIPLTPRFTGTAGVNVGFLSDIDLGLYFGLGYNFSGF